MGFLNKARALLPLVILAVCLWPGAREARGGAELAASGDQLCALFVTRIVKYVSWPASVQGGSGTPVAVAATDARAIRPHFAAVPPPPEILLEQWPAPGCRILLLNGTPPREAAAIIERLKDSPVLTIGYGLEQRPSGLMVNLRESDGRLSLEINPRAALRAGITISSRLLQLARILDDAE
ncbi:YfiR family protein [Desulfovibrio sp.]